MTADINECIKGTHDCHPQATCNNTEGGFTCSCNSGYMGSGSSCTGKCILYGLITMFPGCSEMNLFVIYSVTEMIAHCRFSLYKKVYQLKHSVCSCFCHATYNA